MKSGKKLFILILCFSLFSTQCCFGNSEPQSGSDSPEIKNIILIIGDGMGFPAVGLLRHYSHHAPHSIYRNRNGFSHLETLMNQGFLGISFTEPYGVPVVDSAAAGSQIATGYLSLSEVIGGDHEGNPRETVLELAKRHGKATGLVSDTRITHATPASFASHIHHRSHESEIAVQLLENKFGPDVMLSGGLRYFLPQSVNDQTSSLYKTLVNTRKIPVRVKSRRNDNNNLISYAEQKAGFELAFSREDLNSVHGPKVLGLFSESGMPDAVDETWHIDDPNRRWPTLSEMTSRSLEILDNDPDGFFLMIESGQIDWAEHNQDAGQLLHELLRFDRTLAVVSDWIKNRDDTLLIITSDHDTGGFSLTYSSNNLPNTPTHKSGELFSNVPYQPGNNFGNFEVLDDLYNQKMSFFTLLSNYHRASPQKKTPENLANMIRGVTGVSISTADAIRILQVRENPYQIDGHKHLSDSVVPDAGFRQAFFSNSVNMLGGLIASHIGIDQNISWSTGTHTASPVPVIVIGSDNMKELFKPVIHQTEIGKTIASIINGNQ